MIRRDLDRIGSWTDAELKAAYEDVLNADSWSARDREMVRAVREEMSRRNPRPEPEPRRHETVAQMVPMDQTVNDKPKQQTFEELYKDIRQK